MSTAHATSEQPVYLGARVPADLFDEVQRHAELDDRSVSSVVRIALSEYLADRDRRGSFVAAGVQHGS